MSSILVLFIFIMIVFIVISKTVRAFGRFGVRQVKATQRDHQRIKQNLRRGK